MINKTSNKTSTTKPSESKKEPKAPEWLFANIAEASKNARKIYFLYIGFLVYCGITVVGTTDRQIILNDAVSLPILKMDVPLNGFFILAPVIAIFVFIYLQLYLSIRKDLINDLKANYPQIGREHLYPWMLIVLDYPKKGFVGRLQSAVVKLSVWCSAPLILMLISIWYVKKHDPILSYIIGLTPIFGTIIVSWFWFQYENIRFKIRKIPKLILNNLGKSFLIFTVILYQWIFLFFIIPNANDGFPYPYRQRGAIVEETLLNRLEPFFCVDLSYQILINKPAEEYKGIYWLDLKGAHLEGAVLTSTVLKQADLRKAHLQIANINNANLQGADLYLAILKDATLVQANLQGADLSGANLQGANLQGANLRGAKNLSVIMLNNARNWPLAFYDEDLLTELGLPLDHNDRVSQRNFSEYNFMKTDLFGAKLSGANLMKADLSGANLSGADLMKADLSGAYLMEAYLIVAYLFGAKLSGAVLSGADLGAANLEGAYLMEADLRGADLEGAYLEGADLRGAYLEGANLEGAYLRGAKNLSVIMLNNARNWPLAFYDEDLLTELGLPLDHNVRVLRRDFSEYNFMKTNLRRADLEGAYLMKADLSGANLIGADLMKADLRDADLMGADLREAKNLTINQLAVVKTLYSALLDPDLRKQIEEKYPDLLEKPKPEEEEKVKKD